MSEFSSGWARRIAGETEHSGMCNCHALLSAFHQQLTEKQKSERRKKNNTESANDNGGGERERERERERAYRRD